MSAVLKSMTTEVNAADLETGVNAFAGSVTDRFAEIVERHAGRLAVVSDAQQWTFSQLNDISDNLASQIEPPPGKEQQPVAILMDHGPLLIASILAVLKTGRPHVVLDSADTPERKSLTYKSSGAHIVFVDSAHRQEGQQLTGEFGQLLEVDACHLSGRKREIRPKISSDIASIVYTSGSTGQPKGVCHSHAMVLHHNRNYTSTAQLFSDDRLSLLTPCHLAASRSALWGALLNGATLFPFDLRLHGVSALPAWIARNRITVMHCVPAVFRTLASILSDKNDERSLDSLRLLRLGGESVLARDVELFRRFTSRACKLMVTLSSTETGVVISNVLTQGSRITGQIVPLGKAAPEMNIELIDDRGDAVLAGEIGRLVVRSRYLATGYWGNSQLTSERFAVDQHDPTSRAFETGDLARLNAEGQYEFCGRSDNRLKVRGHRVDLAEVEAALLTCEFIKESAVIDRTDSTGHIRLVAFLVSAVEQYSGERAVRDALQHRLPNYMVPSIFVRLDKMPRTASGKIDRQALLAHEYGHCHTSIDPSNQPLWRQIADIWEQMLGKGPVGADDDFFLDQGASSLQAASVVVKLERLLRQRVSLATLMRFRTARTLAEYFEQPEHSGHRSKLLSVQPGQPGHTPFFFLHGDIYGAGLYCPRFAQSLGCHRPFFAVMPLGFDGGTTPQSRPAMAHHFVGDIRRAQPKGPYLLGGFCNGGLVAFEIAQQLRRAGQQVAVLALIRAKPAMTRWPGVRSLIDNLGDMAGLSSDRRVELYWNVHDRLQGLRQAFASARRGHIRSALKSLMKSEQTSVAHIVPGSIQHADSVMNIHRKGALVYLPARYPGRIDIFWPREEIATLRRARGAGWNRFASEVALHTIPGGHHTCITEHVKALACPLRELLDEADR